MYRIKLTPKAKRELKILSKLHKEAIGSVFEDLKDTPFLGKPLTRELTGRYTYRIGVYRIIYKVNKRDKQVTVLTVGHRSTIYS